MSFYLKNNNVILWIERVGESINGEDEQSVSEGELSDEEYAPFASERGVVEFLLDVEDKIKKLDHKLKSEELDKSGSWVPIKIKDEKGKEIDKPPIMEDDIRRKFIAIIDEFCNRIFSMSYFPEYNDIMLRVREIRGNLGDFLSESWMDAQVYCKISFLRLLRDTPTRMIESIYLYALEGGMRKSIRQGMKTTEVVRRGTGKVSERKGFPNIFGR